MVDQQAVQNVGLDIDFEIEGVRFVPGTREIERVGHARFQCRVDKEFLIKCLKYGSVVAAIGTAAYLLTEKYSVSVTRSVPSSVIFDVVVSKNAVENFKELVKSGIIKSALQEVFEDVEGYLEVALGVDFKKAIDPKELGQLKKVKIADAKLCSDEAVQRALDAMEKYEEEFFVPPPQNLSVRLNPLNPTSSILVFYERPKEVKVMNEEVRYIITVRSLSDPTGASQLEVASTKQFAIASGLSSEEWYLVWVQSEVDKKRSTETLLHKPIQTAFYDEYVWNKVKDWNAPIPAEDTTNAAANEEITSTAGIAALKTQKLKNLDLASTAGDSGLESASVITKSEDTLTSENPVLWDSNVHMALNRIFENRFPEMKMKSLLNKCHDLGISGPEDLKYLKGYSTELDGYLKPIEQEKLVDYASKPEYITPRVQEPRRYLGGGNLTFSSNLGSMRVIGADD